MFFTGVVDFLEATVGFLATWHHVCWKRCGKRMHNDPTQDAFCFFSLPDVSINRMNCEISTVDGKNKHPPIIKIDISNFRGHLAITSLLEIDPESCSDQFGGVESDFWWILLVLPRFLRFGNDGFRRNKPRGLRAAWPPPRLVWPPLAWLNLFRQQYLPHHILRILSSHSLAVKIIANIMMMTSS